MTRDIAQKFNNKYGEILKIPKAIINEDVAVIPGLDGRKMSKSYNNTIEISLPPEKLKEKVMSIKTDSTPIEEPMDYENCNVFNIYKYFANKDEIEKMKDKYKSSSFGYGHAKIELFNKLNEHFKPIRKKRNDLLENKDKMYSIIEENTKKAREISKKTLKTVKQKIGLLRM
jgi:tryptophanyl-tRNA synthetase